MLRPAPIKSFQTIFSSGGAPCAGIQPGAPTCPLAVSLNTFPTGTLKTPYYYQYNLGIEQQIGSRGNLRVDYVGTRGLHEPYQVQLNGYQNVCNGCFAPFPYQQPLDQRFGNVTEFQTGANSNYNGLQTAYTQQWGGLTLRGNYTFSHCLDEVSNGGLLAFSTQGLESPLPGELSRQYASCDYDVRHNISAFGMYQVPFHSGNPMLRQVFGGWSFSETAFLHSGLPFSVLSQPYSANGNGVFQASNPAQTIQFAVPNYANRVPGVPLYRKTPYPGVTVTGTKQWLNPDAFVSVVDPTTGACYTGALGVAERQSSDLPVRQLRPQLGARAAFHVFGHVHHEDFSDEGRNHAAHRRPDVQCVQPSQLCAAQHGTGRRARLSPWQDSERCKAPLHRLPVCLAWGSEETARRA